MNNKTSSNFSLKKLILAALVTGPMAILPAPLWALPGITATNLTTSTGVTVSQVGANTLNITAPDKAVLSWVNFGGGADTIGAADTLTYTLPSAAGSVLNLVTGALTTQIDGSIVSNGNVYVMNPNGIVIGNTAVINVGGFYASSINEPLAAANFANTGTLSYNGTAGGVTSVAGVSAAGSRAQVQAIGSGNNIVLAGGSVNVGSGVLFGNVTARSIGGNISLATAGALAVNQVNGAAGNLTLTSNGGNVSLSGAGVAQTGLTAVLNPNGTLAGIAGVPIGTGYAPNSQIALSITAPTILQSTAATNTSTTTVGRAAAGFLTTDAGGNIIAGTLTDNGIGYVAAPTVTVAAPSSFTTGVAGNLSINTTGTTAHGAVSQGDAVSAGAATITTGSAASTLAAGAVTLGNVNFTSATLPYAGAVSISDSSGGIALGNSKIVTDTGTAFAVTATGSGSISMASSSARVEVVPTVLNPNPRINLAASTGSVTFAGTGALAIGTLTTSTASGTATITGNSDIMIGTYAGGVFSAASFTGRNLVATTTGGALSVGNLTNSSGSATLTATGNVSMGTFVTSGAVSATSSAGTLTAGLNAGNAPANANASATGSTFRSAGDLSIYSLASPGATIASTAGSVSIPNGFSGAGSISAATDVSIGLATAANNKAGATAAGSFVVNSTAAGATNQNPVGGVLGGRVTSATVNNAGATAGAGYAPNSTVAITFAAPSGLNNTTAAGYATTNASGQISGIVVTEPGSGYTTAPSITFVGTPVNAINASGALSISATNGSVSITAPVVSTASSALTISSGQSLSVPAVTASTLNLTSTAGGITQTGAVVSSGTATLTAATDITLSNAANDFGTLVVKNAPSGATVGDANAVVVGNGTDAKGNLTVNAGLGLVGGLANGTALTLTTVQSAPSGGAQVTTNASNGQVDVVNVVGVLAGYTPNQTNIAVTFSAPPADVTPTITAASTGQTVQGYLLSAGQFQGVVLPRAVGNGYRPGSIVPITITANVADVGAVSPTGWEAVVNASGQISTIRMSSTGTLGSGMAAAPTITIPPASTLPGYSAPTSATGFATANSNGVISSVTVTNAGTGYFGSYAPRATIAAGAGITSATATVSSNGANAVTGVNITGAGLNYNVTPVVTGGGLTYTVTRDASNGTITSIVPTATGGVSLGSASSDVINVVGDLTVSTAGPAGTVASTLARYSEVTTGANSIRVNGKVTANTTGANVTLGAPTPLGSSTAYFFGSLNGNVGTGSLTAFENTTINLGTITAASVAATSISGDIVNSGAVTTTGDVSLSANSFFSPGTITLDNATNAIAGNVNLLNASSATVRNSVHTNIVSSASATGRGVTGNVSATASANRNIAFSTAGGGDFSTVGFNVSGSGTVTVNDPNGVTISNAVSAGTGTATVTATGPVVLGSGISLLSSGGASFTSNGATANIADSAPGMVVFGPASFSSANGISVTQSGHSFGPVSLAAGSVGATAANIAFTEAGGLNLRSVSINAATAEEVGGSVVLTSTSGDILQGTGTTGIQLLALANVDPLVPAVSRSLSLTAAGSVNLTAAATNNITVPVSVNASTNSSVSQNASIVLGDVTVRGGTFGATTSGAAAGAISQATGSKIVAFGDTTLNTQGGAITLGNAGNNFGGLTLNTTNGAGTGANVTVNESGTVRLVSVNTGITAGLVTGGSLTVTSEKGSIVSGPTPVINAGGAASLTAPGGITLSDGNTFRGTLKLTTAGSASVQNGVTTTLASGSSVGGSMTIRNTAGNITDAAAGGVNVTGAIFLDAGGGDISITGSGNQFGAVQFRGFTVNIAEDTSLNLAGGSVANGNASLTSLADILTSGVGTSVFSGTSVFNGSLQLNAGGKITVGNNIFVANGLTFRALGAVDLSAASQAGNLNGRAPVNLGASSYKAPSP